MVLDGEGVGEGMGQKVGGKDGDVEVLGCREEMRRWGRDREELGRDRDKER